jgi:hypothetical protein
MLRFTKLLVAVLLVVGWGDSPADAAAVPEVVRKEPLRATAAEVCSFSVQEGRLVVQTKLQLPENAGYQPLLITGVPGTANVMSRKETFRLTIHLPSDKGNTAINILQYSDRLSINRTTSTGDRSQQITYSQNENIPGGALQLTVLIQEIRTGQVISHNVYTAANLPEMRRRHANALRQHLGPILRMFNSYVGMGADPGTARQVLAEPQPKADLAATVKDLVTRLDAENFAQRDAAATKLKGLGADAGPLLRALDRSQLSEHQKLVLAEIIHSLNQLSVEELNRLRRDREFLIDCLYCEEADLTEKALAQLQVVVGKPVEFDNKLSGDSRDKAIEALRVKLVAPNSPKG